MKPEIAREILSKVKLDYDTIAGEFSETRVVAWPEFEVFKSYLKPDMTIADIGCGNGRLIASLPNTTKYIGVDVSEKLLQQAQKRHPDKTFITGSLLEIPLGENSIDATFCIASLHHIPSYKLREKSVNELYRITKPGEYVFITVWNLWQKKYLKNIIKALFEKATFGPYEYNDLFISWQHKINRYYHAFTKRELRSLLEKKFTIEKIFTSHHNLIAICKKG